MPPRAAGIPFGTSPSKRSYPHRFWGRAPHTPRETRGLAFGGSLYHDEGIGGEPGLKHDEVVIEGAGGIVIGRVKKNDGHFTPWCSRQKLCHARGDTAKRGCVGEGFCHQGNVGPIPRFSLRDSTNHTALAPLEAASKPRAPVPANKSSTVAPGISLRDATLEKMASRTRSEVGLETLAGATRRNEPASPAMILVIPQR